MSVEIGIIIALVSCAAGVIGGVISARRGQKTDDQAAGRFQGEIIARLDGLSASMEDVKRLQELQGSAASRLDSRVTGLERDVKTVFSKLEELAKSERTRKAPKA